jgi:hypothetical protein
MAKRSSLYLLAATLLLVLFACGACGAFLFFACVSLVCVDLGGVIDDLLDG